MAECISPAYVRTVLILIYPAWINDNDILDRSQRSVRKVMIGSSTKRHETTRMEERMLLTKETMPLSGDKAIHCFCSPVNFYKYLFSTSNFRISITNGNPLASCVSNAVFTASADADEEARLSNARSQSVIITNISFTLKVLGLSSLARARTAGGRHRWSLACTSLVCGQLQIWGWGPHVC